jgi:nucleoside-diphosphate-sugar epimerase
LVASGHEVTASTHREDHFSVLQQLGAKAVVLDALDEEAVREAVLEAVPEVVVNQITSLSTASTDYGTWLEMTNRLRVEATMNLMDAARRVGSRRFVAQSASFMTDPQAPDPTDESTPLYLRGPEPLRSHAVANDKAEQVVVGTPGIQGVALRYGFLYGEGTAIGPAGDIASAVKSGGMPIVGAGKGKYPFIHVRDAVAATKAAVHGGPAGIYNIVDDDPAPQADWLPYLAELLDAPAPDRVTEEEAQARFGVQAVYYGNQLRAADNTKAKRHLTFVPEFPSWRAGFRDVFLLA